MVVDSEEKQNWISSIAPDVYLWIALTNDNADYQWDWELADGSKILLSGYAAWLQGEPNYHNLERCAVIMKRWINVECGKTFEFVCERTEKGEKK